MTRKLSFEGVSGRQSERDARRRRYLVRGAGRAEVDPRLHAHDVGGWRDPLEAVLAVRRSHAGVVHQAERPEEEDVVEAARLGVVGDEVVAVAGEGNRVAVPAQRRHDATAVAGDRDRSEAATGDDRAVPEPVVEKDVAGAVSVVLVGVDVLGVARERDVAPVGADLGRERLRARRALRIAGDMARQCVLVASDVVHEHVRGPGRVGLAGREIDRPAGVGDPVPVSAQDGRSADVAARLVGRAVHVARKDGVAGVAFMEDVVSSVVFGLTRSEVLRRALERESLAVVGDRGLGRRPVSRRSPAADVRFSRLVAQEDRGRAGSSREPTKDVGGAVRIVDGWAGRRRDSWQGSGRRRSFPSCRSRD